MAKANKTASTAMTMTLYREQGFTVWKTEYYFKQPGMPFGRRKDLLGFIDVLAFNKDEIIGVQDTSLTNMGARKKKILASPYAWDWLQNPHRTIEVVGWKKYDKPVDRKYWRPTVKEITLADFTNGRPEESDEN